MNPKNTIRVTLAYNPNAGALGRSEKTPYQITKIVGAVRTSAKNSHVGDYLTENEAVYLSMAADTEVTVVPAKG
jgi:hypothetical protein